MISSTITGISILDSPVQVFSIDNSQDLVLNGITIDDSAGDAGALGHNTDAFDVGDSIGITMSGANVKNQDDCLAINSGTVSFRLYCGAHNYDNNGAPHRISLSLEELALAVTVSPLVP